LARLDVGQAEARKQKEVAGKETKVSLPLRSHRWWAVNSWWWWWWEWWWAVVFDENWLVSFPGVNLGFQDFKYGSSPSPIRPLHGTSEETSKTNNSTFHTAIYISPFPLLFQLLLHRYLFSDPFFPHVCAILSSSPLLQLLLKKDQHMSSSFTVSVTNDGGALISLQVTKDMTIETLKACISADLSIAPEQQQVTFSGTVLANTEATLESYGITAHEMLQVSVIGSSNAPAAPSAALAALQASANDTPVDDETLVDPSLRMEMLPPNLGPRQFHNIVRLNPQLLAQIEYTNPNLAKALRENDFSSMRGLLITYQMAAYMRKRKTDEEDQRLNDNPWDTDAQNAIAERIRKK